jgi:hypothetical protein
LIRRHHIPEAGRGANDVRGFSRAKWRSPRGIPRRRSRNAAAGPGDVALTFPLEDIVATREAVEQGKAPGNVTMTL